MKLYKDETWTSDLVIGDEVITVRYVECANGGTVAVVEGVRYDDRREQEVNREIPIPNTEECVDRRSG